MPPAAPPVETRPSVAEALGAPVAPAPTEKRPKRSRKGLIPIILLSVALAAALGLLGWGYLQLTDANTRIEQQDRELEQQRELIDKKETFSAAMQSLQSKAAEFEGVLLTAIVPVDEYEVLASSAWAHRWESSQLDGDIADAQAALQSLSDLQVAAATQASTNVTGTTNEAVIDSLGSGFVASVVDDADTLCETDVLACVVSDDPYTIHFDAADITLPYMTDFIRTGLAYHEFAHSLQMTNPGPTETALESFGGDPETMADCFALTYLDGWKLDHQVFVSSTTYYQVSIGYGYTCNEAQKQVIRDWYSQLGYRAAPISQ